MIFNYNKNLFDQLKKSKASKGVNVANQMELVFSPSLREKIHINLTTTLQTDTVPIILLNTEQNSEEKNLILKEYGFIDCYYFYHALAASDWFRGYRYHQGLIDPSLRKINKKFFSYNRITGNARVYRSLFVAELQKHKLLNLGHLSYNDVCPEHGHYKHNLLLAKEKYNLDSDYIIQSKKLLDSISFPLRIDFTKEKIIPNDSQTIGSVPEMIESFLHVVTETCFWEKKQHLTEKIFKPIVARQPFVLLGCANNLKYLQSYGFKTFNHWWDEGYDQIQNPIERLQAVVNIINQICQMSNDELENLLSDMSDILNHNYNLFYSKKFIDGVWNELITNLETAVSQAQHPTLIGI